MTNVTANPFSPVEVYGDGKVKVKENDQEKLVNAKHYHIRYVVGEGSDKRYIDSGDSVSELHEKMLYLAPSIHKLTGEPHHYDISAVQRFTGDESDGGKIRWLVRSDQCEQHPIIEVSFQSPGLECCAMSMDEADKQEVPVQYLAGYLLGRSNGLLKVALTKTV
ncbi:MAG: hypothetical protein QXQ81_10650, partial [Candidatus Thorarchaeota archaeon]